MKPRGSAASVLGNRLRQLREAWGLVLQDVANLFGTNRNVPSQWEGGLREPSYDHLLRLADFYGVTVDWLLGREGAEKDSPRVSLIKNQLHDYLRLREATLRGTTPGNRVRVAIDFLILQDPELFTVERVARQLVISSETLAQMLDDQVMTTPLVVQRFAQYTNLPEIWFYQPVPQLEDPFVKYRTLVERFQAEGLSPDDVEQRLWGSRRTSRRTKRAEHE
ncbi:MAG TPA: helix-turn-helix transcriptional regulator [Symbiobacteriaceae bacterium]|jgi:transcriptional regulator with XRE-family HTH domain|nr:helix-turn-helix transcriptional regulator [Symbiobacteriaceae bacterium]